MVEALQEHENADPSNNEAARLAALRRYNVLDTPPEETFDRIALLAADRFGVPMATVSLIDQQRQWFKARVGMEHTETSRDIAFCAHAIRQAGVFMVPDALKDSRFAANPLVVGEPKIRFYAGAPLTTPDGYRLGTLCIIDRRSRPNLTRDEQKLLGYMADLVVRELEFRFELEERAKSEAKLVESEARFRASFEIAPHGMALVSPTGKFLKVNSALCAILGYSESELLAGDFQALTYPEELDADLAHVHALLAGRASTYSMEKRYIRKDGVTVWAHLSVSLVRDSNGAPVHFVSQVQNIQDRKNSEAKIVELVERNRLATEAGRVGISEWRVPTDELIWDASMFRLYGFDDPDRPLSVADWASLVHPDDRAGVWKAIEDTLKNGVEFDSEFQIRRPSGEIRYIRGTARIMRDEFGAPIRMVGVNCDITENRMLAERLEAEKRALEDANRGIVLQSEELRTLAEATAHGLLAVNRHYKIIHANSVALKLFDYTADELIGKPIETLVPEYLREAYFGRPLRWEDKARKIDFGREIVGRDKRGNEIPLDVELRLSRNQDGPMVVATIFDLRPRLAAEQALRSAKEEAERANRAKSEFLTIMSHELRTPLNAVLGFGQLLQSEIFGPLNSKQKEFLEAILGSGDHLLNLINEILELSRIEAGQLTISIETIEVLSICRSVLPSLEPIAAQYRVSLDFGDSGLGVPPLLADRTRLEQCLRNLGSNAIKYNRPNGTVTFSYDVVNRDYVRFSVTDTGFGIPEDRQPELFQPFNRLGAEQKAIEGTGVGLALTKRLAQLMGGSVGFVSKEGEGSTFWIDLPRYRAPQERIAANG